MYRSRSSRRGMHACAAVAATLLAAAVAPAVSGAATLGIAGGVLTITGTDAERDQITIRPYWNDATKLDIVDDNGPDYYTAGTLAIGSAPGCTRYSDSYGPDAERVLCSKAGIAKVKISTGDQPTATYESALIAGVSIPSEMDGGAGPDTLHGSDAADILRGGPGLDSLYGDQSDHLGGADTLDGGPGDDSVYGYAGDDVISGGDGSDGLNGDEGDDELHGGASSDRLNGDDGDDALYGEGGSESSGGWLWGGDGSDLLDGGDGDDSLAGEEALNSAPEPGDHDTFVGGPGQDETGYTFRDEAVKVTLDGQPNDGQLGDDGATVIENDNVGSDVETVYATLEDDTLIGDDGANDFDGQSGDDVIQGLGGADELDGDNGDDSVDGGAGDDSVYGWDGNDALTGGEGNDLVEGGADDDVLDGGAGVDSFAGDTLANQLVDSGNDTIRAQDGNPEPVSCGPGTDTAFVDHNDTTSADPGNVCETISATAAPAGGGAPGGGAPGGGAPGGGGPVPGPGGGPGGSGTVAAVTLGAPAVSKLAKVLAKGLAVPVTVAGPGTVKVAAYMDRKAAKKVRLAAAKRVLVAKGGTSLFKAGAANVKAKFTAKARKRLKKARKVKLTLVVTYKPAEGATTTSTRAVTLKK